MSGTSTLDPDNMPVQPDRELRKGHDTGTLGPSDSSDSGSDVQGGPGDTELDSDSDAQGTGERAGAGRDTPAPDGADIDVDHVESLPGAWRQEHDDVERGA
ncbi:hypothetical protein [Pseudoduganella violaceinigra]|uniref:hypothetical protein n=1 Tax=Pseudoduganella violaceinigra TaxID=246602 RepID=UPI000408931E|nr:hypothetical protein [Pseudoduganella violaceinigra]